MSNPTHDGPHSYPSARGMEGFTMTETDRINEPPRGREAGFQKTQCGLKQAASAILGSRLTAAGMAAASSMGH